MNTNQAVKELHLNIKHQKINTNRFMQVGYEFDKGQYCFMLIIPNIFKIRGRKK